MEGPPWPGLLLPKYGTNAFTPAKYTKRVEERGYPDARSPKDVASNLFSPPSDTPETDPDAFSLAFYLGHNEDREKLGEERTHRQPVDSNLAPFEKTLYQAIGAGTPLYRSGR